MDLVTESLLNTFKVEQDFPEDIDQPVLFEHFANYCVTSKDYAEEFKVESLHVGGGDDLQLDGVVVIVNGVLINSTEEVDDLANTNKYLDAEFILIQAKSGGNFEGAQISNMFYGAGDLFSREPSSPRNEYLTEKEQIIRHIYSKSSYFRHGNPKLKLYYVTTGKWYDDDKLVSRIRHEVGTLEDLNIFRSPISFEPVDAKKLQQYFNRAQNALSRKITFAKKVTLPPIEGVREAYLGYLSASVYLKMITDEDDTLLRGLFYDNVRDFQGDNLVNKEIEQTLQTSDNKDAFIILNNGITIVSEDLKVVGDEFELTGFQVVNGCQTSHVLFNNRDNLSDNIHVPIKLIVAPEDNLKNQVIKATNRQTEVKTEELLALTDFQKTLEQYYDAIPTKEHRLYYERRSQKYRSSPGIEKIRIVTIPYQIRSFASMFLNRAHRASRYYGTLLKDVESKIFIKTHLLIGYYLSSYALFRIESFLRRHQIDNKYRPFKYHLLGIIRMQVAGVDMPQMTAKRFETYCKPLQEVLWDDVRCLSAVQNACSLLDTILAGDYDREKAKDSTLQNRARELIETQQDT